MYSSRGSNAYGQQSYAAQQVYGQNSGPDGGSMTSRHSAMLGAGAQEADIAGYRAHPSAATHYGGPYGAVYGSSSMSSVQQVAAMSDKGAGSSALQGRTGYAAGITDSPKFASADYVSSSGHGYGHKSDQFSTGKLSDYSSIDRRHYDLQSEASRRYADSVSLGHQLQPEMYDHIDQASLLRQQQLLKSQSLQSASPLDGGARQADYLAARGAPIRHATQDISAYGGRIDADPRTLSMLSGLPYGGQHQSSILGAAPRRNVDDLMYAQGSSTSGYGVSLPPGRDYGTAKGLHATSLDSNYPGLLSRGGAAGGSRMDERKDDRGAFRRELEIREEERRREHVREREKEREKERERERNRERERERERERRDRDRERERKRVPEIRRERTPPRISRDRHGSSLGKEDRPLRRDSPRHETLHRRHSPVKEKRRDYICKVYPSCLVDVERDYLSINKRYPKLSISPEFSKVVLNWPKESLNISFHTPVSFEHDVVELESSVEKKQQPSESAAEHSGKSKSAATVWNAKVMLMSGISKDALEELSSDKSYDDRIPHINNILRFSFLRKDRAFMAIGGPQDVVDGRDPSVDDSSLIKTAISYTKDLTQLDLQKCQRWNRFLEIHYDRVGKDGLFSHKEITVIYIPDLSECLPSLDAWKDQWLAHKEVIAERERHITSQKEKKSSDKDSVKGGRSQTKSDKDTNSPRIVKMEGKLIKQVKEEKKEPHGTSSERAIDGKKTEKDGSNKTQESAYEKEKGVADSKKDEIKDGGEGGEDGKQLVKMENEETNIVQGTDVKKPGKKKIIKKVVKQKVADKKAGDENPISTENEKGAPDKQGVSETTVDQDGTSVDPASVKTFTRKKIVKKVPVGKIAQKDKGSTSEDLPTGVKLEGQEDKVKDKTDPDSASVQEVGVKAGGKKKIIKRVPKRKATQAEDMSVSANDKMDGDKDESKVVQKGSEEGSTKELAAGADKVAVDVKKLEKKNGSKPESKKIIAEKKEDVVNASEIKDEKVDKKEKTVVDDKKDCSAKKVTKPTKEKGSMKESHEVKKEKAKDEKDKKDRDDSRRKLSKEVKEKGKPEEQPPKHPGLILQTKSSKESKIRSMSLSLDALLDYNDKDIEESTFELSVFAESLYEMLQYQMGYRLLTYLQKLRINFVKKRNQRKRERDENPEKANDKEKSSRKRPKTTEVTPVEKDSAKAAVPDDVSLDLKEEETAKEDASADGDDDSKMDYEADDYDPEEDIDEDQEMEAESPHSDTSKGDGNEETDAKEEKEITNIKVETVECAAGDKTDKKTAETGDNSNSKDKAVVDTEKKAKSVKEEGTVDKELLQAFRFFDRNRVGYIKVEDLRLIIHNLGKFLSHRDVKELVQSALLESNTARDNRILYKKLVKRSDF